jgi:hypothetical protein
MQRHFPTRANFFFANECNKRPIFWENKSVKLLEGRYRSLHQAIPESPRARQLSSPHGEPPSPQPIRRDHAHSPVQNARECASPCLTPLPATQGPASSTRDSETAAGQADQERGMQASSREAGSQQMGRQTLWSPLMPFHFQAHTTGFRRPFSAGMRGVMTWAPGPT